LLLPNRCFLITAASGKEAVREVRKYAEENRLDIARYWPAVSVENVPQRAYAHNKEMPHGNGPVDQLRK